MPPHRSRELMSTIESPRLILFYLFDFWHSTLLHRPGCGGYITISAAISYTLFASQVTALGPVCVTDADCINYTCVAPLKRCEVMTCLPVGRYSPLSCATKFLRCRVCGLPYKLLRCEHSKYLCRTSESAVSSVGTSWTHDRLDRTLTRRWTREYRQCRKPHMNTGEISFDTVLVLGIRIGINQTPCTLTIRFIVVPRF